MSIPVREVRAGKAYDASWMNPNVMTRIGFFARPLMRAKKMTLKLCSLSESAILLGLLFALVAHY